MKTFYEYVLLIILLSFFVQSRAVLEKEF